MIDERVELRRRLLPLSQPHPARRRAPTGSPVGARRACRSCAQACGSGGHLVAQHPAQDLAGGRLRDLVDDDRRGPAACRCATSAATYALTSSALSVEPGFSTTKPTGISPASSSGVPITAASVISSCVSSTASSSAGGDLEALVLDQLLEPVDDVDVARRRRSGRCRRCAASPARRPWWRRSPRGVEVALHHLRAAHPQLALGVDARGSSPEAGSTIMHSVLGTVTPDRPGLVVTGRRSCGETGDISVMP